MERRNLILGGIGAVGAVALGAYFQAGSRRKSERAASTAAAPGKTIRPALVFVGHEL